MRDDKYSLFNDVNSVERRERGVNTAHVRELYSTVSSLESRLAAIQTQINTSGIVASATVAPMNNFVDNSDFVFSLKDYSTTTDITARYILDKWYGRLQSIATSYYINTSASESEYSVRVGGKVEAAFSAADMVSANDRILLDNIAGTAPTHGLTTGDAVKLSVDTGSTLPSPLNTTTTYYVKTVALSNYVQLTTDSAGLNVVDFDNTASGTFKMTLVVNPRPGVEWDTASGTLATSGGYTVASRLSTKYAFVGNTIYFKMQIAHQPKEVNATASNGSTKFTLSNHGLLNGTAVFFGNSGTTDWSPPTNFSKDTVYYVVNKATNDFELASSKDGVGIQAGSSGTNFVVKTKIVKGLRCKASLWDNINNRIFRGDKPTLTTAKIGSHIGGSTTRTYILEVQMPDGRRFYSNLASPQSIIDTVSTSSVDNDSFVTVRWDKINGASRYNVYRKSDSGPYYLIETVPASVNSIFDYGGGSIEFTPPATYSLEQEEYHRAQCIIDNVTDVLDGNELVAFEVNGSIIFPSAVTGFAESGDQFLQIEFLKPDGTNTTLVDIPEYSLLIDKVALSYVYGRWHPSARDQAMLPIKTIPSSPVISGGGGDGTGSIPTGGGGGVVVEGGITRCVHELTNILVWSDDGNHFTLPANAIVIGDRLVSWDGEKLAPSKVQRITNGISMMNYRIYANDNELVCSFSHRLIQDMNDFPFGTNVGKMDNRVVVYDKGNVRESDIDGIESFSSPMKVVTFKMEKGKENYVSSGIFSHNAKSDFEPTLPSV